ncbi:unnamed protein product [Spirodela intermedia]|uniref:Uncharacterized protein n=2 Tax=Spirodela intermedia TaxID=51605 RepID=A0A7I8KAT6_SPIIN|nr:unnamed protein product [Spirodela intermedia]CAA7394334.1 unnamed protein product [Spirodela intermedia]
MGRRVVFGGCHLAEQKNSDFASLRRLSPEREGARWRWGACQGASSSKVATHLPTDHPLPDNGFPFLARVRPLLAPQLAGHW